jgi:2',3'-cyclic-nucleotide 2'-phosphodiesterase (5'-nucleotidase family)
VTDAPSASGLSAGHQTRREKNGMSGALITSSYGPQFVSSTDPLSVAKGAEVAVHDAARGQVYVIGANGLDALDATTLGFQYGLGRAEAQAAASALATPVTLGGANSVAVSGDVLAVAYDGAARGSSGAVVFYDLTASPPTIIRVVSGADFATPDQIVFTPDGSRLLVAIEGEPADNYASDPKGGVAIIDVATGALQFAGFDAFDASAADLRATGVFMTGRSGSGAAANTSLPSRDLEPEYVAINAAGTKAYVSLQENNAIGVLDIASATFEKILPLGLKSFNVLGNGIDPTDTGGVARIGTWPIFGAYMPDGIAAFESNGRTFLVTANEGDAREWGNFVEPLRISNSAVTLDAAVFSPAMITALKDNAQAGRVEINRFLGNTDGDAEYEQLITYGGRSVSIFEVTGSGANSAVRLVWDSGQDIDTFLAVNLPARYDDGRSDNKGAEPEGVTVATIDGAPHIVLGLERANMLMDFRVDLSLLAAGGDPRAELVGAFGGPPAPGIADVAPEVFTYIPGVGGAPGAIVSANEVSGTVRRLDLQAAPNFTLQILHGSDFEAGLLAPQRAPNFAAIVDVLEETYVNSITLASGDNWIPGPFLAASADAALRPALRSFYEQLLGVTGLSGLREAVGRVDVAIMNALGVRASVFGNHEFDLGTNVVADAIDMTSSGGSVANIASIGAMFPYLSANLNFATDPALAPLFTAALRDAASYATTAADLAGGAAIAAEAADRQISPWTTITVGGETIGVLGATTQVLRSISSPGNVGIIGGEGNDMTALAAVLQPHVDQMTAQGINKIVLLSHLQQNAFEIQLAGLLSGVDVIIAGGSHAIFADDQDTLRAGDSAANDYPVFVTGTDGKAVAVVNTGGEYSYVGRLVLTFDAAGVLIADPDGAGALGIGGVDASVSGAYATDEAGLGRVIGDRDGTVTTAERATAFADGTRGGEVKQLTDAVQSVIAAKDGIFFGYTDVFLEGRRGEVRTEETNLGGLTADANLWLARQVDPTVLVSLKNGGGIRAEIGAIVGQPVPSEVPPLANAGVGKPAGAVSQLDIENSLRFNNGLSVVTFTAADLVKVIENALRGVAPGATPGGFPQVGGLRFSFDADRPAGDRVVSMAVLASDGSIADVLVKDGDLVGDPGRGIRTVALNFNLDGTNGGDNWLSPTSSPTDPNRAGFTDRVDLFSGGSTAFTAAGREQQALAQYLAAEFATPADAFDTADTTPAADTRVQNLDARADAVLPQASVSTAGMTRLFTPDIVAGPAPGAWFGIAGTSRADSILGTDGRDLVDAGAGDDQADGGLGADSISGAQGADSLAGGEGNDTVDGGLGADLLLGGAGDDSLQGGTAPNAFTDTLDGGAGADTMSGGRGDDLYRVDAAGDVVIEDAQGGLDRVESSISFVLPDEVEQLVLLGGALAGTGNALNNLLVGNLLGNALSGGEGADTILGDAGDDMIEGGGSNDDLQGGAGADTLTGGAGADTLTGGADADIFRFTAGSDSSFARLDRRDVIADFVRGEDKILLDFDASVVTPGEQLFAFTTGPFLARMPGLVRVEAVDATSVLVLANMDNNTAPDFAMLVRGTATLDASDFLFA